ncbi:hypothetical protein CFP56_021415 [Quercus suber]|uniref:Uncharacterized protein n=1 Tax=Quercus suber TaxID=58331 RepID=A0AAW0KEV8_QUESU
MQKMIKYHLVLWSNGLIYTTAGHTSKGEENIEGPAWAPLLDNYMLTNSKLKDWDNMLETTIADEYGRISEYSSSDDPDGIKFDHFFFATDETPSVIGKPVVEKSSFWVPIDSSGTKIQEKLKGLYIL